MVYTRRDAAGLSAKDLLPPRTDVRPVKPRDIERKKWKKRFAAQPAPQRPQQPQASRRGDPYASAGTSSRGGRSTTYAHPYHGYNTNFRSTGARLYDFMLGSGGGGGSGGDGGGGGGGGGAVLSAQQKRRIREERERKQKRADDERAMARYRRARRAAGRY